MNIALRYVFILGFFFGVGIFSYFDIGVHELALLFVLLSAFALVFSRTKKKTFLFASILTLSLILGGGRLELHQAIVSQNALSSFVGGSVVLEGVIVDEPDRRERNTRLILRASSVESIELSDTVKILLRVNHFPQRLYGDRVRVTGVLEKPLNFLTDTGRTFDYVSYLGKDQIFHTISFPEVELLGTSYGNPVKSGLFAVKQKWLNSIEKQIPDPQSALLGGLVVGAKQSLGDELEDKFRETGIIHIVVLSGYNVTIVAEAIMRFFAFLAPSISMSLGGLAIVFFAIMTGASATTVVSQKVSA